MSSSLISKSEAEARLAPPGASPVGAAGMAALPRWARILSWLGAGWIAWEFGYYEQFKLTGDEGSVHLFTILSDWLGTPGGEKPFRLFVGSQEIIAAVLVLLPWTRVPGAALSFMTMAGAIFFHLASPLGVDPYGDGGVLFTEAVITLFVAAAILVLHRSEWRGWIRLVHARIAPWRRE
ncbi:hypothetical protein [Falsiroseomonas sp. HW251]|uniref:hypothetical protein n=1 Tax=Falsiroseomonas sp. HW251 TaxID=3390998 RepID=UPI003D315319